jgi:hypothetical protein
MTDNSKEKEIIEFNYEDYEWVDYSSYEYYPCVISSKRTISFQTPKFVLKHLLGFTDQELDQGRSKKYRSFFKLGRVPNRTEWQFALAEDEREGVYFWSPFFTCILGTPLEDPYGSDRGDFFPDDELSPRGCGFCFIRYPSDTFMNNVYDGHLGQKFETTYKYPKVIKFLLRRLLSHAYLSCKKREV